MDSTRYNLLQGGRMKLTFNCPVLQEFKLIENGKELSVRYLHPTTKEVLVGWSRVPESNYRGIWNFKKKEAIENFKKLVKDSLDILPDDKLPKLLNYYHKKLNLMSSDSYFQTFEEFKMEYIESIKKEFIDPKTN